MRKEFFKIFGILFVIMAIFIALFLYYPEPEIKIPELNDITELDSFIEQVVKDNGLPSMAVALLDSSGVQKISVFGVRKKGKNTPVTNVDLYHLGSNTKAMTSVLTAMMIDDGFLNWDTKIIDVFPKLAKDIHIDYQKVTIHDLLTHTAGIQANYSRWDNFPELKTNQRRLKVIEKYLKEPAQNKKGEYLYSNLGYIIAGAILERVTSKSWETLMREKLFSPLKMKSADFGVPGTIGEEDQPWGHIKVSGLFDYIAIQKDNHEVLGPAGTVHCNIEDWGKFISFQLMSRDTSLLNNNQRIMLLNPVKNKYACGWSVVEPTWADEIVYTHAGSNTMNFSQCWIIPKSNKGILINSNAQSKNIRRLFRGVRNAILKVYKTQ